MIAKMLGELQKSRQVHPKKLVAALFTGLKDQSRTISGQNSTTIGIQLGGQLKITRTSVTKSPARG